MKYFYRQPNKYVAINKWNNSQFDLIDIVLSLTDNGIYIGEKIYAIFCRPEVLNLMQYFVCDFDTIKRDLGINGEYVERGGNIYSKNFNPKRYDDILSFSIEERRLLANNVYRNIMNELYMIVKLRLKRINTQE